MLKEYEVVHSIGLFDKIRIIDDEFEEVSDRVHIGDAVVDVYGRRNLPIAANLMKGFVLWSKKYGNNIDLVIKRNKHHIDKYKKDFEKYMVLL